MRAMSSGDRRDRKGLQVHAESTGPPCSGTKDGFVSASCDCTNTRRRGFARKPARDPVHAYPCMKISAVTFRLLRRRDPRPFGCDAVHAQSSLRDKIEQIDFWRAK